MSEFALWDYRERMPEYQRVISKQQKRIRLLEAAWEAQVAWEKVSDDPAAAWAFTIAAKHRANEARRAAGIQEAP